MLADELSCQSLTIVPEKSNLFLNISSALSVKVSTVMPVAPPLFSWSPSMVKAQKQRVPSVLLRVDQHLDAGFPVKHREGRFVI
jgi:hypothetical protein